MAASDPAIPDRFFAAANYAGFRDSGKPLSTFSNETALLLYGLYQQATVGPCNVPKPRAWSPAEQSKWESWSNLQHLSTTEAMRLFVKILEEEDPAWFSRASNRVMETEVPLLGSEVPEKEIGTPNGIAKENGGHLDTVDKDVVLEGLAAISVNDQWVVAPVSGRRPTARYEHVAEVVQGKMYIVGGNYNGRYLNDVQVLDLKSLRWLKIEPEVDLSTPPDPQAHLAPCAGHSLVKWGTKLLVVAGHTKDSSDTVTVRTFDTETHTWSIWKAYGNAPQARGGQTVNLVGSSLIMFGGEDSKRHLLNDVHILDLETMTWDAIETRGTPPAPRSDHAAAVHLDRYVLIFGGGSHSSCFNDLHVLDLQNMEWSQPQLPDHGIRSRAGHAGVTVGEYWYIVGGGDNKSGVSETIALNMSKLAWTAVTDVKGRVPIASEGLSVVSATVNGEDVLVTFGGYNGKYSNEVHILKPSRKQPSQQKILQSPAAAAAAASVAAAYAVEANPAPAADVITSSNSEDFVQWNMKNEEEKEKPKIELQATNEGLRESLLSVQSENNVLRQKIFEAQSIREDLTKELQSVRGLLQNEQSKSFKLELDIADLKKKLSSYEDLQKQIELLRSEKAAAEEAALQAVQRQKSGGVWRWIAGTPPPQQSA